MIRGKALAALSALSHGDRLDLVRLLFPAGAAGLPAGEIARGLGLSASRLSFHLAQLEGAGLIRSRRVARNVIYTVDRQELGQTIRYLLSDCCGGDAEVLACCRAQAEAAGATATEGLAGGAVDGVDATGSPSGDGAGVTPQGPAPRITG